MLHSVRILAAKTETACLTLCQAFLLVMTTVIVALVVSRYLFLHSFPWAEELTNFLQTWMVMLAAAVLQLRRDHIKLDFISAHLPPRARIVLGMAIDLAIALFLLALVRYGWTAAMSMWMVQAPALRIPMAVPYLAIPAGALLMLVYTSLNLVSDALRLLGIETDES